MQPNQPYQPAPDQQQNQQPQQPVVAFQSSAPIGPVPGQAPITQIDPQLLASLPREHKYRGLVTIILLSVLLAGALGFGGWAFMSRQDYKANSDQKSAAAVEKAKEEQKIALDAEFVEKEKLPYDTYSGPSAAGSIKFQYPKTWSAYIVEDAAAASPVNGYLHPGFVPNTVPGPNVAAFGLRFEVANQPYQQVMTTYEAFIKNGQISVAAYSFPSVPGSLGSRLSGQIVPGVQKIQGTMIIMPLRDKTLRVWTESNSAFLNDFETAILPTFSFIP